MSRAEVVSHAVTDGGAIGHLLVAIVSAHSRCLYPVSRFVEELGAMMFATVCESCRVPMCQHVVESLSTRRRYCDCCTRKHGSKLHRAPWHFVLHQVALDGMSLCSMRKRHRRSRLCVTIAVQQNAMALQFAHRTLLRDLDVVLAAVCTNGKALQFADAKLRSCRKVAIAAVTQCGEALQFVDETLRGDGDVVLRALRLSRFAIHHATEALQHDRAFIARAVDVCDVELGALIKHFSDCPKIMFAAVQQDGLSLREATVEIRRDYRIVDRAVRQNGLALEFAHELLQQESSLVLAAVAQNGHAFRFASAGLKQDRDMVLRAVTLHPRALHHACAKLRMNYDVMEAQYASARRLGIRLY